MNVAKIGQFEEKSRTAGTIKAGAAGALIGGALTKAVPLTKSERDFFLNSSAVDDIAKKVQSVRLNEIDKIIDETRGSKLDVLSSAAGILEKNRGTVSKTSEHALDLVENSSDEVKDGFKMFIKRVDAVGTAKNHIETNNIKAAAKAARPVGCYALAGALMGMSLKIVKNVMDSYAPKKELQKTEQKGQIGMADILLDGLGTNAEILYLANNEL